MIPCECAAAQVVTVILKEQVTIFKVLPGLWTSKDVELYMVVTDSFEMLGTTFPVTQHHNPGDQNPPIHCCENLKTCTEENSNFRVLYVSFCIPLLCFNNLKKTSMLIISSTNFNAQFSLFVNNMFLHYYPRHVSSINMPIFWRKNCIHTAS